MEKTVLTYIIRDHDTALFEYRKERLVSIVETLNKELDRPRIQIELKDQYYNMKEIIEKDMTSVDVAIKAMKNFVKQFES